MAFTQNRDGMLDLLNTDYIVSASQTIIAQWNHNFYTKPLIYGSFMGCASGTNLPYTSDSNSYSASMTNDSMVSLASASSALPSLKNYIVRIMFDAKISEIVNVTEDISEFMIKIVPRLGTTEFDYLVDMHSIKLSEDFSKVEFFFEVDLPDVPATSRLYFDNILLYIKPLNDAANIDSGYVSVEIKNLCTAFVSKDEIKTYQASKLSRVFSPNRVGDQIVDNNLISSSINPITKYHIIDPLVDLDYNKTTLFFNDSFTTPPFLSTFLNPYNEDVYYLTSRSKNWGAVEKSEFVFFNTTADNNNDNINIYAIYENLMKTNQIYVKTQNFKSPYLDNQIINPLYGVKIFGLINNGSGEQWQMLYQGSPSVFTETGCMVLQYDPSDATWKVGKDDSNIASINLTTGQISSSKYVNLKGLHVLIMMQTGYSNSRVIEISPRFSVDLSNFLISTKTSKSFDSSNGPIPIGLSEISTGNIVLENLPRTSGANKFQVFDNNDYSPLNGLIKSDTKFTIYTTIKSTKNTDAFMIKNATLYAEEWSIRDVQEVDVSLNDYGKYLQNKECPDLLLSTAHQPKRSGTLQNSLEAMFQLGGFSDYDIESLNNVSLKIKQSDQGRIPIFFCKKENKIWDTMSQMLLGYQISTYFDEDGILKFRDIIRDTASYTSYSDNTTYFNLSNTNDYGLPNIISFNVQKNPAVGKIKVTYRDLSITNNIYDANGNIFEKEKMNVDGKYFKKESNSKNNPYTAPNNTSLICVNVIEDFNVSSTRIKVGDFNRIEKGNSRFITGFNGYGMIQGEVISWDGIEYAFTPVSGFKDTEIIRSNDELETAISERFVALAQGSFITKYQPINESIVSASFSSAHNLNPNMIVNVKIVFEEQGGLSGPPENITVIDELCVITAVTATTASFKNSNWVLKSSMLDSGFSLKGPYPVINTASSKSYASRGEQLINFKMTGYLCNVRRGLFGTYATEHKSQNRDDPSAFTASAANTATAFPTASVKLGMKLERSIEPANATNFVLDVNSNSTRYIGFNKKDSRYFSEYHFTSIPKNNLDTLGIFIGARTTVEQKTPGASVVTFQDSLGMFIEFFSPSVTFAGKFGAIVRIGPRRSAASAAVYVSEDKLLHDTWRKTEYRMVPLKDKDGNIIKVNDKPKLVRKKFVFPPKQNKIIVKHMGNDNFKIIVNGTVMKFRKFNGGPKTSIITVKAEKTRTDGTLGMFSCNGNNPKSTINIQEITAFPIGYETDRTPTWTDINAGHQNNINKLITYSQSAYAPTTIPTMNGFSPKSPIRPFTLRATPIIRGIEINDVKWDGDAPFYDLSVQDISGMLGQQLVLPNSVSKTVVIGTPFRGRFAFKNNSDEVVYTNAESETYIAGKVFGKSINIINDKSITRILSEKSGLSDLEIDVPWSAGESTAQNIADTILRASKKMNNLYDVEIFGNPALRIGDHVKVTYTEKNMNQVPMIITSIENNFSDGGITTSLKLRDVNWA